ncbi:MAG: hypothetical protein AB7J40_04905 [Candidatus Altimarinota bacterium]
MIHFIPTSNYLFAKRFIFFAGDGGGPESFAPSESGQGPTQVSEAAAERAAEERRQAAAAAKQQRKEEKKIKRRDNKLADIIKFFIQGHKDDRLAILLSRLLHRNTPADILLAVLSLNFKDVVPVLEDFLEEEREVVPDAGASDAQLEASTTALVQYGQEMAQSLSQWTRRIFTHASFHPMKSIIALAHHHGVDHHMIQLTAYMIQDYFKEIGQEVEFERIREFSELFWRDTLKRLHHLAGERGLLPDPSQDPLRNDDDDDDDDY